ncbi:MAG: NAD-dependent epimerase/dehydratase family protein [Balneolales bacterium]
MKLTHEINGKRILITGGTGFIGGRLIEILKTGFDVDVRVLVSNFSNVARIARFPIDMVKGDILNPEDVRRAARGCDVVFHCAYGNSGTREKRKRINIEGTKNILSACMETEVKRLVHLSTIMVYGHTGDEEIDETAPHVHSGGLYSDSKLEAEQLIRNAQPKNNLSTVILQPTAVYGPYAPVWGVNVLDQLKNGLVMLINGGNGFCNAVYIDDLVNAMLLAAVNDVADGESIIISGEYPISWQDFYGYFENMLGFASTIHIPEADAIAYTNRVESKKSLLKLLREDADLRSKILETSLISSFRKAVAKIMPDKAMRNIRGKIGEDTNATGVPAGNGEVKKPVHSMSDSQIRFFKATTHFRIDKPKKLLGYKPRYDFDAGMKITRLWADSANLLAKDMLKVK